MSLLPQDYEQVLVEHRRLVRELDVLINGEGAAQQASLCDIVAQVKRQGLKALPLTIANNDLLIRAARAAKEHIHAARLCNTNSMSSRDEMLRLMQVAIEKLDSAIKADETTKGGAANPLPAQDVAQAESLQQPPGRCTYCLTFNGHQDGCTHAVKTVHTHPAPAVAVNEQMLEALKAAQYRLKEYRYQAMEKTIEKVDAAIAAAEVAKKEPPAVAHGPDYKACCTEWLDKTEWVQERGEWPFPVLGMHRADVMKKYIEHLESQSQAAAVNEQMLQLLKWVDKFIICAIGESVKAAIAAAEAAKGVHRD